MSLAAIIAAIEDELAATSKRIGSYSDDPSDWHRKHHSEMDALAERLQADHGATINKRFDGCKVRIEGIASSSTSGIAGALSNWLAAARRKMEKSHG